MKVFIGKYRSRKVSDLEGKYLRSRELKTGKFTENKISDVLSLIDDIFQAVLDNTINIYYDLNGYANCNQRKYIKIDEYDTWGMNTTLAHIIVPMLEQLKDNKGGAPWVDLKDAPLELSPSYTELREYEKSGTLDTNYFKRWDYVLGEMIFAFKFERDEDLLDYWVEDKTNKENMVPDSEYMKMKERVENGRMLFAKYYSNLWD